MIFTTNVPIFSSRSFSQKAESTLINSLLEEDFFNESGVQRMLASYPSADDVEKDLIVFDLMDYFWKAPLNRKLFAVFRDFDTVFTILGKKGHFIHSFEVFLLGWFIIIHLLAKDKKKLFESKFGSNENLFYCWLLTSTAHDFGYPLQIAKELADKFSLLYKKIHLKNLSKRYIELSKEYKLYNEDELNKVIVHDTSHGEKKEVNIDDFVFEGIKKSLNNNESISKKTIELLRKKNNHGYVSAMILSRVYIQFIYNSSSKPEERKKIIDSLQMSVAAIALHSISLNHKKYISKISFNSNPLAYLLLLIDNLQEWHRSLRPHDLWPSYNLDFFEIDNNSLQLSYILSHENWTQAMERNVEKSLEEKRAILLSSISPSPRFHYKISISFLSSLGKKFEPINLSL